MISDLDSYLRSTVTAIFSSQEFNQNPGRIKKAAEDGPVIVTERGQRKLVILNWAEYEALSASAPNIVDLFYDPTRRHRLRSRSL
jgi:prevent-host-death family protein